MKIKKAIYIVLGCIGVGLGAVGAVLPLLPAFPFLMLAVFCFAKSSEKLHSWFVSTKLYKKNLESFVKGKGMTRATKFRIMTTVTLLMAFGFTRMMLKAVARRLSIWISGLMFTIELMVDGQLFGVVRKL